MGRILLSICAVVVAVGLGAGQDQPMDARQGGQQSAQQDQASAAKKMPIAPTAARPGHDLEADQNDADARRETERADADLKAQKEMARWALGMFIASAFSVVIGAVGVGLIYTTFQQTHRAATSAEEIVTVTRESAGHQLRAYVGPVTAQYALSVLPTGGKVDVLIELQNFGQTPAYQYRSAMGLARQAYPLVDLPKVLATGDTITLFPSMKFRPSLSMPMTLEEVEDFRRGDICCVVTVIAEYLDLNGISRSSNVRYLLHSSSPTMTWEAHTGALTFHSGTAT